MRQVTSTIVPIATSRPCVLIAISNVQDGAKLVRALKETYGDTVHAATCETDSHLICVVADPAAADLAYNIVCRSLRYPAPDIAKPIGFNVAVTWLQQCTNRHDDLVAFLHAATT